MKEYNQIFDWYVLNRNPNVGVEDVLNFTEPFQAGTKILDLGCGDGIPVIKCLLNKNFKLYGIDSSSKMIDRFKEFFPGIPVECSSVMDSDFFNEIFDAVIGYGFMFQLPQHEQAEVIKKVSDHLKLGGRYLFNSGDEDGETVSEMDGIKIPQYSMSSSNYEKAVNRYGMSLIKSYFDHKAGTKIYIAEKQS